MTEPPVFIQMYSPSVGPSVRINLFFQNGATWKNMIISRIIFLERKQRKNYWFISFRKFDTVCPRNGNKTPSIAAKKLQIKTFCRIWEISLFFGREGGRNSSLGSNPGGRWCLSSRISLFRERTKLSPLLGYGKPVVFAEERTHLLQKSPSAVCFLCIRIPSLVEKPY